MPPRPATLASFATFAVGFLARPFGGLFFGHFGDRWGRKPMLVATLMLVGGSTFAIGLLPTYAQVGVWAPVLLLILRLAQGFGAGAEYGGAVVMAVEFAPPGKRGLYGAFAPMGTQVGSALAGGCLLAGRQHGQGPDAVLGLAYSLPGVDRAPGSGRLYPQPRERDTGVPGGARASSAAEAAGAGGATPQSAQFLRSGGRAVGGKRARLSLSGIRCQLFDQQPA